MPVGVFSLPMFVPTWTDGTLLLVLGFALLNLLILLEVADRLSLKNDLEIARDIQLAMLPHDTYRAGASRCTARRGRPTPSAATSTTSCRCRTAGS